RLAFRLPSQPAPEFRAVACLAPRPVQTHLVPQAWLPAREVARVADIRYLRKTINGAPVLAAPVTVVVDMIRTRFCYCCGLHTLLRPHHQPRTSPDSTPS